MSESSLYFLIVGDVDPRSLWSMEKMQAYISLIKTINPELTEDASRCVNSQESKQLCFHINIEIFK